MSIIHQPIHQLTKPVHHCHYSLPVGCAGDNKDKPMQGNKQVLLEIPSVPSAGAIKQCNICCRISEGSYYLGTVYGPIICLFAINTPCQFLAILNTNTFKAAVSLSLIFLSTMYTLTMAILTNQRSLFLQWHYLERDGKNLVPSCLRRECAISRTILISQSTVKLFIPLCVSVNCDLLCLSIR